MEEVRILTAEEVDALEAKAKAADWDEVDFGALVDSHRELVERFGLVRDRAKNGLAAMTPPVRPQVHLEGLEGLLKGIVEDITAAIGPEE